MKARIQKTLILLALALPLPITGCGDKDNTDTDTDTDADNFFLHATGTFDGIPFTVDCPEGIIYGAWVASDGIDSVNGVCGDAVGHLGIAISAINPEIGSYATCDNHHAVQVIDTTAGAYYACSLGGTTAFTLTIDEIITSPDDMIWGGSFSMAGSDGTHSTETSGSFRVHSTGS